MITLVMLALGVIIVGGATLFGPWFLVVVAVVLLIVSLRL